MTNPNNTYLVVSAALSEAARKMQDAGERFPNTPPFAYESLGEYRPGPEDGHYLFGQGALAKSLKGMPSLVEDFYSIVNEGVRRLPKFVGNTATEVPELDGAASQTMLATLLDQTPDQFSR